MGATSDEAEARVVDGAGVLGGRVATLLVDGGLGEPPFDVAGAWPGRYTGLTGRPIPAQVDARSIILSGPRQHPKTLFGGVSLTG